MKNLRNLSLIFILFLLASANLAKAQDYKFRKYGIEEGICHPFVYTINQDKNGYLWFGTGEGLCRFDGLQFRNDFHLLDSIDAGFANVSYKDRNGNLWFGHNDGTVTFYNGRRFMLTNTTKFVSSTINGITGAGGDTVFVAAQNEGVLMITSKKHDAILLKGLQPNTLLYSLVYAGNNQLLVGTQDGLHIYALSSGNELQFRANIDEIPGTKIQSITADSEEGSYWIGTEDEGYYRISRQPSGDFKVTGPNEKYRLPYENVQSITRDQDGNLWIGTFGNGAFKIDFNKQLSRFTGITHFNDKNGLGSLFIKSVFQDMEGNIWLGTYGKGAAAMVDQAFLFYNYTNTPLGNNILSIATDADSNLLWLGSPNGILETDQLIPDKQKFFGLKEGLPHDKISALYLDKNSGKLWIGTAESGIYTMNTSTKKITSFFSSQNSLDNAINCIAGSGGKIWVATNNGVFAFNPESGAHEHWSTNEGLPHNKISQLYIDPTGLVWIATKSNSLYAVNANKRYKIDGNVELEFKAITADNAGNLWACTDGDGVFRFSDDTLHWFSTDDGLRSNYGYSMITDQNGDIWTGHRLAISRIDAVTFKIKGFGTESGISGDCNNNAVALGSNGRILFGTTDGLVIYNTRQDEAQQQAPVTNITALRINDKEVQPEENITLPYGSYKLRIEYIGLNYQDPKEVYYQYKMVGYDVDTSWSEPTTQTYVQYGRITDGNFVFKIRSCNQSGICNETPVTLHIRVKLPVWKTWWFITLSFILLIVIIYLIIKIRERKQIQFQKFLQEKLDERTREVIEQKEEIEIKNKDITDSINYAQRIQASILPSIKKLQQNFSGCFVFYQPRDIVSGDFYWFDRISKDKFVIVCADSTGHGVPGAFMSMIGTTLIKDICSREPEQSPSNILTILDREIHNTLNQNIEAERSNDGMDIIVCEINISNYYVRFASAMRPLIVYQNGEEVYIKGSRSTIGGSYGKEDKVFEDEGLQLSKGDIIYMFSDGYPDQFGGPMGKKFKMVRLKNLLRDIYQKPMDEQYEFVKNNFMLWKDENEQVDDVLFMGIKI